MRRSLFRAAAVAILLAWGTHDASAAIEVAPCDAARGETFASAAGVTIATAPMGDDAGRSVLTIEKPAAETRSIPLSGRAVGLTVTKDGLTAFAIVRTADRKGRVRGVDLARIDLTTHRASTALSLPLTARGVALSGDGGTLFVTARDELRTFRLPGLASGPLFGVAGDNVGLAPLPDSTYAVVAQPTRLALIDLSAAQGRDGLPLSSETVPPGTLRGLMAAAGESGPVALTEDGRAYCVRAVPPSPQARAVLPVPPPKPSEAAPSTPPPAPPEEPPKVEEAPVETRPEPPPETAPVPPPPVPVPEKPPESSGAATTRSVFGQLTGPSLSEVAAVVFLGPDNILHEAARVVPDGDGRYETSGLAAGAYRIVAAGKAGRVLLCDPSFITVHVGANGAVEAPVLKVLHAP